MQEQTVLLQSQRTVSRRGQLRVTARGSEGVCTQWTPGESCNKEKTISLFFSCETTLDKRGVQTVDKE